MEETPVPRPGPLSRPRLQELTWDGNDTTAEGFSMFFAGLRCNSTLFDMPVPVKDVAAQLKLLRKEGNEVGAKALEQTRANIERQLLQNLHMKRKAIAGTTMRGAALKKRSTIGSVTSEGGSRWMLFEIPWKT